MTSEAKIAANRRNARKSTGPRTARGKGTSSRNSIRHGILASDALISAGECAEDQATYEALWDRLSEDLGPEGSAEEMLVERFALALWRLRRLYRFEHGAIRDRSDEVSAQWAGEQSAQVAERNRLRLVVCDNPSNLETWIDTEELKSAVEKGERRVKTLSAGNRFDVPRSVVGEVLADAADDVPAKDLAAAMGLTKDDGGDPLEVLLGEPTREQLEGALAAVSAFMGDTPEETWNWLKRAEELHLVKTRTRLEARLLKEERLRLTASIPAAPELERVTKYESHLTRQIDRILDQLERYRRLRDAARDNAER
jgi:hypothetical protein